MPGIDDFAPASRPAAATRCARQVVFVNRYFYPDHSATSQILHDLSVRLVASGTRVTVITSRQLYERPDAGLPARENIGGVEVHRVAGSRFGRGRLAGRVLDYFSFFIGAFLMALRLLRPGDALVAKTDPPMLSVACALAARLRRARLINWMQDVFPEVATALGQNPLPRPLTWLLEQLRDGSMRRAVVNVVLGDRMHAYLAHRRGLSSRLRTIPNWADMKDAAPIDATNSRLRRRLGLERQFVVGYSGNLGRAHDYETLLAAAEELRVHPDVSFLITGGGTLMDALKREADARGLSNLRFLPYQPREELADCLAAADVHLACLRPELECFVVPCKFYGILAAARPVVFYGDADGELARIIRAHDCGRAVRMGDGPSLARALLEIRELSDRGAEMGRRGYRLFRECYTADRAARDWTAMLGEIGIAAPPAISPVNLLPIPGAVASSRRS